MQRANGKAQYAGELTGSRTESSSSESFMQYVWSQVMVRLWILNYCSISFKLVEYSNLMKRRLAPEEDDALRAALLTAKVSKTHFKYRGAAFNDRNRPRKGQESRSPEADSSDLSKLTQAIFIMKAR